MTPEAVGVVALFGAALLGLVLLGLGGVVYSLRAPARIQRELNESLRRIGEQEILGVQMRIQIEAQHETIGHLTRYAQQVEQHLSEVYAGLLRLPEAEQRVVLGPVTTARPPPFRGQARSAPRYIRAEVIQHMAQILNQTWLTTREQRDGLLLAGLSPKFTGKIPRSGEALVDLTHILTTAFGFGPDTFRMVVQNAVVALNGSGPGEEFRALLEQEGYQPIIPIH